MIQHDGNRRDVDPKFRSIQKCCFRLNFMQSKDSGWKTLLTNLIKRKLKNEGTLWVSINGWTPYTSPPPYPQLACAKRGLRIFRGQGVLATLSGKLKTDHVLLVFFLGYFFFLSLPLSRPPWQTVVLEMFWMTKQSPPLYLVLERSLYLLAFLWLWAS